MKTVYVYRINAMVASCSISCVAHTPERAKELAWEMFTKNGLSQKNVNYEEVKECEAKWDPESAEARVYYEGHMQKFHDPDRIMGAIENELEDEYLEADAHKFDSNESPAERMERLWREGDTGLE